MLALSAKCTRRVWTVAPALAIGAIGVLMPSPASAHFYLQSPTNWVVLDTTASGGGNPQKGAPCGNEAATAPAGTPTGVVTAFQAGQTISIQLIETIPHPGWYRIALVQGKSSTQTATSLPNPPGTTCVPTVVSNPTWSPTQPIIADGIPSGSPPLQVTIPQNVTGCTMANPCTLQVVMVMTDHIFPNCYYHHCADVTIGSTDGGGSSSSSSGGADASVGSDASHTSSSSGASSSGAAGSSSSGAHDSGVSSSGSSSGGSSGSSGSSSSGAAGGSSGSSGAPGGSSGAVVSSSSGTGGTGADASTDQGSPSSGGCSCLIGAGGGIPAVAGLGGILAVTALRRRRRQS
jgi:hypothetical protein